MKFIAPTNTHAFDDLYTGLCPVGSYLRFQTLQYNQQNLIHDAMDTLEVANEHVEMCESCLDYFLPEDYQMGKPMALYFVHTILNIKPKYFDDRVTVGSTQVRAKYFDFDIVGAMTKFQYVMNQTWAFAIFGYFV